MHYAVIGAGYTGRRVLKLLPSKKILALGRTQRPEYPPSTDFVALDLDAIADGPIDLPSPCSLLYSVPPRDDEDSRLAGLLARLVGRLARIVYLSTTGVYGDRKGALVTERDIPEPVSNRAIRRLTAENMLTDWCEARDTALIVLRVPAIYGPGRLGLKRIKSGEPVLREADANPGNRIHVDDLAACCVRAMTTDCPAGVYNVGDGNHRSGTWFSQTVARLAGLDAQPEISRQEAQRTFSEGRLSYLSESRRIDTTRMRELLDFKPQYLDPTDGIRASLAHSCHTPVSGEKPAEQ
ncbi:MAG: NAD-dependent epimerase/dehydratase family protein [Woeseiaceae bacterium]